MIPDKAIEAACDDWFSATGDAAYPDAMYAALEAAAPFIRAQALVDAADERYKDGLFKRRGMSLRTSLERLAEQLARGSFPLDMVANELLVMLATHPEEGKP